MYLFICYPKCSTCKKAKAFLDSHNISYKERNIKTENPTSKEIKQWSKKILLKKFFNTSGIIYKELSLKEKLPNMTEEEQIELLSKNGMLVKRPILITENEIILGFKEKEYEGLLWKPY